MTNKVRGVIMWDESKHPRDERGRFTSDGNGGEHIATPAEEKRLEELGISYNGIYLSRQEYAKVSKQVAEIKANAVRNKKPVPKEEFVFTADNFYKVKISGNGFMVIGWVEIENNEKIISGWLYDKTDD